MPEKAFEALYKSSALIVGNPYNNVCIVTLWTKAGEIAKKVDKNNYAVMGQLFSAERGLDLLIRNLLANPQLTKLVITGVDYSKSGIVLKDFFEKGFSRGKADIIEKECWRVNSSFPGYIGIDIPENALNKLRESINVITVSDIESLDFSTLKSPEKKRTAHTFIKKEDESAKKYIGEDEGYVVRHKYIAGVWVQILDTIMKFGLHSDTHYEEEQKEVLNLLSIIEDEDPENFHIPEFWDPQRIKEYLPRMTQDIKTPSSYTYGSRMRSWFGTDQVKNAIAKLVRQRISRAVVIDLWDSTKDLTIGGSPCVNHIWLRIREGKLYMTVTIRSNDMFDSYPENAFGLRTLQELIRKELLQLLKEQSIEEDIKIGHLIINSQSAHIYKDCFEKAQKIIELYYKKYINSAGMCWDPRGNFVIEIQNGEIILHHLAHSNEVIGTFKGKSAKEVRDHIIRENVLGNSAHAMYLGIELAKAETALKLGIEYVQDEPLNI